LSESPRAFAAQVILDRIAAGDPADAVILTADFNAAPSAPSRKRFHDCGLIDAAERAGQVPGQATFHFQYGIGVRNIDGILVDSHWRVGNYRVVDFKPQNVWPSDHFALLADIDFAK
jgi:endonuclease/exonuclease/phosphatase family metal-dependent hydrolase